jgi:glycosyltransferase involved in cell wall biosynthesis
MGMQNLDPDTFKILIIIPAYNESKNIVSVIESLNNENPSWDLLVINDGSQDRTAELAESTGKAFVINLPCNLGIGGAVQTGFKFAKHYHYDIAVQCDGDGQHRASEIPKLLDPILRGEVDVVIGSRFCQNHDGWKSTFSRRCGIKIFEIVSSLLIKQRIMDNTSGFRAYNKKSIDFLADHYPIDYPEPEAVILLGRNGFTMKEVLVGMQERQSGQSSISGLKSVYYMIKVILSVLINVLRPRIFS